MLVNMATSAAAGGVAAATTLSRAAASVRSTAAGTAILAASARLGAASTAGAILTAAAFLVHIFHVCNFTHLSSFRFYDRSPQSSLTNNSHFSNILTVPYLVLVVPELRNLVSLTGCQLTPVQMQLLASYCTRFTAPFFWKKEGKKQLKPDLLVR